MNPTYAGCSCTECMADREDAANNPFDDKEHEWANPIEFDKEEMDDDDVSEVFKPKPKIAVAYHADCMDGLTAAWVMWKKYKSNYTVMLYPVQYGDEEAYKQLLHDVEEQDMSGVFIVDFSYPVEKLLELSGGKGRPVTVYDHHESAWKMYGATSTIHMPVYGGKYSISMKDNIKIVLAEKVSGALLAWYEEFPGPPPVLVQYISDRDTWQFSLSHTRQYSALYALVCKSIMNVDTYVQRTEENNKEDFAAARILNQKYREDVEKLAAELATPIEIAGVKGLAANVPYMYASDVGHILAKKSGTFGATWFEKADKSIKFSLRSESAEKCNVEKLAAKFGGGGHKCAAGFELKPDGANEKMALWAGVDSNE